MESENNKEDIQMAKIGWLLVLWSVGGWLSIIVYVLAFVGKRTIRLRKLGDEKGAELVTKAASNEDVFEHTMYIQSNPKRRNHSIIEKCPVLLTFAWPVMLELWMQGVRQHVENVYLERIRIQKVKAS